MKAKFWLTVVAASSVGLGALAHSGATGVVKERMDAMDELGEVMKRLTPMMRGQSDYNPDIVRSAADAMIGHAGAQMTELFPEGSNGKPSEALDVIWRIGKSSRRWRKPYGPAQKA